MNDILHTAAAIREDLRNAERNADLAIASIAAVTMRLATSRAECDDLEILRAHGRASQAQLLRLSKLQTGLLQGRGDMARVHGGLLGIGVAIMGPDMGNDCPGEERRAFFGSLRAVA